MYTEKLPAQITSGEKKGQQAQVKITNEKLGHPKDNPILINQDLFEYPQFGRALTNDEDKWSEKDARTAIEEFITDCGSAVAAAEIINSATKDAAVNKGKGYIRTAESGNVDDVVLTGLKASSEFSWKSVERVSARDIVDGAKQLAAKLADLTPEQIAAEFKKLMGAAA